MTNSLAEGVVGSKLVEWFKEMDLVPVSAVSHDTNEIKSDVWDYTIMFEDGIGEDYRVTFTPDRSMTILEVESLS